MLRSYSINQVLTAACAALTTLVWCAPVCADEPTLASLGDERRAQQGDEAGLSAGTATRVPEPRQAGDDPALAALMRSFLDRLEPRFLDPEDLDHRAIPDGQLLVFQARIGRYTIDAPVTAVKRGRGLMVPVGEFARSLYLAIEVDPDAGRAEGWAFSEDNVVTLDARSNTAQAGDKSWRVQPGHMREDGADILVHTDVLAEWLDVEFDIDFRFLLMRIKTERSLPIIAQLERRKKASRRAERPSPEPVHPAQDDPYRVVDAPVLDAQATYSVRETADGLASSQLSHSVIASGDMARMSGLFFLSGDDKDVARVRRMTLSRVSPEGGIAGPLDATRVELGDVQAADLPFAAGASLQRGVRITNAPVGSAGAFGTTDITGDVQPGWDVELYRNGVFLGLQTVEADGHYSFLDVPLFSGTNQFRIVSYGPQGQVREETRSVAGDAGAGADRVVYDVSLVEQGRSLLGGEAQLNDTRPEGLRGTASARMQVRPGLVADVGVDTPILEDGRHTQLVAGATVTSGAAVVRANARADVEGGHAVQASVARPILGQQARVSHAVYTDFPGNDGAPTPNGSSTSASLGGQIRDVAGRPVSYQLNGVRDARGSPSRHRVEASANAPIAGLDVDTALSWRENASAETGDTLLGSLGVTRNANQLLTRARLSADLDEGELLDANVSARYRLTPDVSINGSVQNTFATGETVMEARADWDLGRFEVGPRARWSSEGDWSALVDGRMSLGWDPLRNAPRFSSTRSGSLGAMSVRVFEDLDGNGVYSRGDVLVEGAGVDAVQVRRGGVSDADGLAFLERLPPHRRTDIQIAPDTLEDPYLAPVTPGVSVEPRPGLVQTLDIALVATSEVEGAVTVRTARGTTPVAGALVRAVDAQGAVKAEARSASDGFFILSHIPVGTYRLLVDRELLDQRGWRADQASFITVRRAREIVVRNISLAARDAPVRDPLAGSGITPVDPNRLLAALEERRPNIGFAVSLGVYHTNFGRNAALMILLARFPDELEGMSLVSPDASPLGEGFLTLGPVANAEKAKALCERFGDAVRRCRIEPLGFRAVDAMMSETTDETASDLRRSVAALRRLELGGG